MNFKLIGIIFAGILFFSYSAGLFYLGVQHTKSAMQNAVIKAEDKQDKEVEKTQILAAKRETVYQTKYIQIVEKANDEACLDAGPGPTIVGVLNQIRSSP